MNITKLVLTLFFLLFVSNTWAATGCYVAGTGYVYPEKVPGQPNYSSKVSIFVGVACTPGGGGSSTSCFVNGGVGNGFLGDYSATYCPIDDKVSILLSAVCLIGFLSLRIKP